jgi:16S rRNA (guanine966-N2)-methyltransferase
MERFAEKKYGETRLWFAEPGVEAAEGMEAVEATDGADVEVRD